MTKKNREEFRAYLRGVTDAQIYGVLEKERAARRRAYANLAREELARRNLMEVR